MTHHNKLATPALPLNPQQQHVYQCVLISCICTAELSFQCGVLLFSLLFSLACFSSRSLPAMLPPTMHPRAALHMHPYLPSVCNSPPPIRMIRSVMHPLFATACSHPSLSLLCNIIKLSCCYMTSGSSSVGCQPGHKGCKHRALAGSRQGVWPYWCARSTCSGTWGCWAEAQASRFRLRLPTCLWPRGPRGPWLQDELSLQSRRGGRAGTGERDAGTAEEKAQPAAPTRIGRELFSNRAQACSASLQQHR